MEGGPILSKSAGGMRDEMAVYFFEIYRVIYKAFGGLFIRAALSILFAVIHKVGVMRTIIDHNAHTPIFTSSAI